MSHGIVFGNRLLDIVLISTFAAQFYKVFVPVIKGKRPQWIRLFQTGGMPSSHASTVIALSTSVAFLKGITSLEFAISMVFSSIVLYDATGIRRAAGEQAKVVNKLVDNIERREGIEILEKDLKEFLGHTPVEVFWGCILGVIIAFVFKGYLLS